MDELVGLGFHKHPVGNTAGTLSFCHFAKPES